MVCQPVFFQYAETAKLKSSDFFDSKECHPIGLALTADVVLVGK